MSISPNDCCVLNEGSGAWAFEPLAHQLSSHLGVEVSSRPRRFNYLLHVEDTARAIEGELFIPAEAIRLASDKRLLAKAFDENGVPAPETHLVQSFADVLQFVRDHGNSEWCLKYPISCGASGHRLISSTSAEPPNWPRPFIVQEFIRMKRPEVFRAYCAAGELFGWLARRFPTGSPESPWVAHARGARYENVGDRPDEASRAAHSALQATGLWNSFGCADLLQKPTGKWLVLEVGTDGLFNHVDRDVGDKSFERDLYRRLKDAFWKAARSYGEQTAKDQNS